MKSNQSLHLTIKEPPNPQPIKTLGIFDDPDNPNLPQLISLYLSGVVFQPKDIEFSQNVKDEVTKLLISHKIIGVATQGNLTTVIFQS